MTNDQFFLHHEFTWSAALWELLIESYQSSIRFSVIPPAMSKGSMMPKSDLSKSLRNLNTARKSPDRNLDRVVEGMRRADRSCHKMMAIEVWAIAKTVDNLFPGFWNRFMLNRQLALRQFLDMKQAKRSGNTTPSFDLYTEPYGDAVDHAADDFDDMLRDLAVDD